MGALFGGIERSNSNALAWALFLVYGGCGFCCLLVPFVLCGIEMYLVRRQNRRKETANLPPNDTV